jgi:hypothetical protein
LRLKQAAFLQRAVGGNGFDIQITDFHNIANFDLAGTFSASAGRTAVLLLQLIASRGVADRAFSGAFILYRLDAEEWQDGLLSATLVRLTDTLQTSRHPTGKARLGYLSPVTTQPLCRDAKR